MKKKLFLVGFIILIIMAARVKLLILSNKGSYVNEKIMTSDINKIIKYYGTKESYFELSKDDVTEYYDLNLYIYDKYPTNYKKPIEVLSIMRIFLNFHERDGDYKINSIKAKCFDTPGFIEASGIDTEIKVSFDEFNSLINEIDIENKSDAKSAQELSEKWILKHHFYRYNLKLDGKTEYLKFILTKNSGGVGSYYDSDKNIYVHGWDIYIYNYYWEDFIRIKSKNSWNEYKIIAEKDYYAAFDDKDRLWVLFEDGSFKVFASVDEKYEDWEELSDVNLNDAVYPMDIIIKNFPTETEVINLLNN